MRATKSRWNIVTRQVRLTIRSILWFLLLCPMSIRAGSDQFVDYLYIEAGDGDSSGGHAALRFAEDVFHYQYDRGLLKAVRANRKEFDYQYRFLGNRNMHVSRFMVPNEAYQDLFGYFSHKHLVQSRQFEVLGLIRNDHALIRKLIDADNRQGSQQSFRYPIKGGSLFAVADRQERKAATASRPAIPIFLRKVRREYGPAFIPARIASIVEELGGLRETAWDPNQLRPSADRYPVLPYALAERFSDLLTNLTAFEVLQHNAALNREARIPSDRPEFILEPSQIEALRRYRNDLERDLLKLIVSPRPDWGYPLLVGLARLMVLDESIQHGRLVLLDNFGPEPQWVDPKDIRRYRETFRRLLAEARFHFDRWKQQVLKTPAMDEAGYSLLESLGNRYIELARGVIERKPMRVPGGNLLPPAIGEMRVPVLPGIGQSRLLAESGRLTEHAKMVFEALEQQYSYHLLNRNCVSEIFQDIERALSQQSEASDSSGPVRNELVRRPGRSIDHNLWNSIPVISSAQIRRNFRITRSYSLLSYRQKRLQEIYSVENPLIAYFRESNILTSTLYPWNPDDGFFLFFTDDLIWFRPLFGAINLAAGIGQILVGGVMAPVAGGDVFIGGFKGIVSSLSELSFGNIRKGSYRYQPVDFLMEPDAAPL